LTYRKSRDLLLEWSLPLAVLFFCILAQAFHLKVALEYQRSETLQGEWWRVFTGNFVHLGWEHLLRDGAGFLLIWGIFARQFDQAIWIEIMITSALCVGGGLLCFSPEIRWYVGLSGVLFGLYTAGALSFLGSRPVYSLGMLFGMIGLLAWTLHFGPLPGEQIDLGGAVVPAAHLYGAAGGVLAYSLFGAPRSKRSVLRAEDAALNG